MNNKKLKGKDVIKIGIFTAIYFAINFGFMLLGGLHPLMWLLYTMLSLFIVDINAAKDNN